jgi:DNA-binding NtrC family response regulator
MEKILLVEDDPLEARTLSSFLSEEYSVFLCPELGRAPELARQCSPAAIVLGFPLLYERRYEIIRKTALEGGAPVLVLSGEADPNVIVGCLHSGAYDFFVKPCDLDKLRRSLGKAIAPKVEGGSEGLFLGASPAIKAVERLVRLYADSPFPVLIFGESGTGKEIAARALHDLSSRRSSPFVDLNCAAIPELLAESELFGTERGAFTDATSRPGAFELARGGLLFLDEIGETGPAVQAKLLRVLETGEFRRLGGRKNVSADFRFVSATGRDLERATAEGSFRADLLYRIDTLIVTMPPLRARREDIVDLASHFALLASRGRVSVGQEAMDKLMGYDWPGNVRQLRNIVHRALVLAGRSEEIRAEHIVFRGGSGH